MKQTKYIFAAALAMLALGCNKEQVAVDGTPDGEEVAVTFAAELPGTITKAIGDGLTAKNLSVAVYDDVSNAAGTHIVTLDKTAVFDALHTTVEYSLVKGKTYHFIFWAQAEGAPYTFNPETKKVAINYTGAANDEKRDAFYAVKTLKVTGPATEPVQLHRPFAQVNFGTSDSAAATDAGVTPTASLFTATDAASSFDVFAGVGTDPVRISFTEATLPAEQLTLKDGTSYTYLAMNYFIPTGKLSETHVSNLSATFKGTSDDVVISVPSAKVQANYRTNIVGNLLTDQVVFNVEIVPAFEDETTIDIENITTAADLRTALANGHSAKLAADIEISKGLVVPSGKNVVLNLGGKTIKATAAGVVAITVYGDLEIAGAGTVDGGEGGDNQAINVQPGAKLVIRDGSFTVGGDANGLGNSCIENRGGEIEIYGGTFRATTPYNGRYYVLNQLNSVPGTFKVYGGKFENYDPAQGDDYLGGNFVAEGYKSTKVGDYYVVTKEDVTPVVSNEGLNTAFNEAANAGKEITVNLSEGTFNWPDSKDGNNVKFPKTINVVGTSKEDCFVKFSAGSYPEDSDVIFENVTIDNAVGCAYNEGSLAQMVRVKDVTVKNCIIKNQFRILAKGIVNIKNCQFINTNSSGFDGYCLNYYGYDGSTVNVENCTFDTVQKAIVIYSEGHVTNYTLNVKDCKFTASDSSTDKAAVQMHTEYGIHGNVTINNCTATGFKANTLSPEGLWWEGKNNVTPKVPTKNFTIKVGGTTVQTAE